MRYRAMLGAAGFALALAGCGGATENRSATGGTDAVIVVPYSVEPGRSRADAVSAIDRISAELSKQPGFVEARLLEDAVPDVQPRFVHVTRWRSYRDWDAVSGSTEFQKVLEGTLPSVRVDLAQVYKPVQR